jgi:hypothetical protein
MATVQEAIRRLTIEARTHGVTEAATAARALSGAVDGVTAATQRSERAAQSADGALASLKRRYDETYRAEMAYAKAERTLGMAQEQGKVSLQERLRLQSLVAERHGLATTLIQREATALNTLTNATKSYAAANQNLNTANLAAQFQDIGVTAAMGMSPLQIALQQGTQLQAILGPMGAAGAVKALGSAFVSLINPVSLVTLAVTGLTAYAIQYFMTVEDETSKAEADLNKHADTVARVADRWGDALPQVKAYAAELERASELADVRTATGATIEAEFTRAEASLERFTTAARGALETPFYGAADAATPLINAMYDLEAAAAAFSEEHARGGDVSDEFARIQRTLNELITSGAVPATGALRNAVNQLEAAYRGAAQAAAQAAAAAASIDGMPGRKGRLGGLTDDQFNARFGGRYADPWKDIFPDLYKKSGTSRGEREAERLAKQYDQIIARSEQFIAQQELEARVLDMTAEAASALRHEQQMLNDAMNAGIKLTPAQAAEIKSYAEQMARAEADLADAKRVKDVQRAWMDVGKTIAGVFERSAKNGGDFFDAMMSQAGQLGQALQKALEKSGHGTAGGMIGAGLGGLGMGYHSQSPLAGALGGAMNGLSVGASMGSVGGLPGMAVGAVVGGIAGLIGGIFGQAKKRREEAEALAKALDDIGLRALRASADMNTLEGQLSVFDKAAALELKRLDQANAAAELILETERALAAERVQLIKGQLERAEDELRQAYEREAGALKDVVSRHEAYIRTLKEFGEALLLDTNVTPLDPGARLREAERQYRETAAAALGGDENAMARLTDVSRAWLDEAMSYYAASEQYFAIFREVQRTLDSQTAASRMQLSEAQQQLAALNAQVGHLISIDAGIKSLAVALAGYQAAQAAYQAALAAQAAPPPPPVEFAYNPAGGSTLSGGDYYGAADGAGSTGGWGFSGVGYSSGGYTGERGGVVHPREFVLRPEATRAIGRPALEHMNRTGQMPGNDNAEMRNIARVSADGANAIVGAIAALGERMASLEAAQRRVAEELVKTKRTGG